MNQNFLSVAIIGKPNSGKSTLLNQIIGQKISIVTPKVQTTRSIITGISIIDNTQIIFFDTPGIFEPKKKLEKAMVKCAYSSLNNADIVFMVIDITSKNLDDITIKILKRLVENKLKPVFLLNKIDLCNVKDKNLSKNNITTTLQNYFPEAVIFEISAMHGNGVKQLMDHAVGRAKDGPWLYNEDDITTIPMRFLAAEITREQLFLNLHEELPYNLTVLTEKWEEFADGSVKIHQVIIVAKENYKAMILGKMGNKIKAIGSAARLEIEKNLGFKAHLFLFVKVRQEWINYCEI